MDDLRTALQETWSKALLAAASVEEQAQAIAGRVQHLVDAEGAQKLLSDITGKLQSKRQELEADVQRAIANALEKMRLPSRAEVDALRSRLDEVEARLASLEQGSAGTGGRSNA